MLSTLRKFQGPRSEIKVQTQTQASIDTVPQWMETQMKVIEGEYDKNTTDDNLLKVLKTLYQDTKHAGEYCGVWNNIAESG